MQYLKSDGVAEIPENILPGVFSYIIGGKRQCMSLKSNPRLLISDLHYYQEKNCLNLEVIEVFMSMMNKIKPECKVISAPALREHSRNYNDLIEKVKVWKKQGAKGFCFIRLY